MDMRNKKMEYDSNGRKSKTSRKINERTYGRSNENYTRQNIKQNKKKTRTQKFREFLQEFAAVVKKNGTSSILRSTTDYTREASDINLCKWHSRR